MANFRPFPLLDAQEQIIPLDFTSMAMVASYGGTTNLVYVGYSKYGTDKNEAGWLILKHTFDITGRIVRSRAVLNSGDKPLFENIWQDNVNVKTVASITKAASAVIETTTDHGWITGGRIEITGCDATEANGDGNGSVMFKLTVLTPTTATLVDVVTDIDVDSSGWAAAATTGSAFLRLYANYTVS